MSRWYILNPDKSISPAPPVEDKEGFRQYSDWLYGLDENGVPNKQVGRDEVHGRLVSTVFLGLDHGWDGGTPTVFESMIFAPGHEEDQNMERYCTYDEALEGHRRLVKEMCDKYPYILSEPEFSLEEIEKGKSLLNGG